MESRRSKMLLSPAEMPSTRPRNGIEAIMNGFIRLKPRLIKIDILDSQPQTF
jgi:hypothetical protein